MITLDIYFNKLAGNGITLTPKQPFSNPPKWRVAISHTAVGQVHCLLPPCALMCANI